MAIKRVFIGSVGPFLYDDTATYPTPQGAGDQGFGDGVTIGALVTDGVVAGGSFGLWDTDGTHTLELKWNENDSANRVFNFLVGGGNRSLTLNEDFTIGDGTNITITGVTAARSITLNENLTIGDGTDVTITGVTQANTFTMNESFTIGNGSAGTLTYSSVCALTVELASVLNQDLTTDAGPAFASCSLGTGELTCGSINRASGTLTLEVGGTSVLSLASTGVTGTGVKDEDNMASNSATHLATQQSIKAYTDAAGGTAFATAAVLGTL